MPYINESKRYPIDRGYDFPETVGELNYRVTTICDDFLRINGTNYTNINAVIGVLECAKLEMYRRVAAPYEDTKIVENGDVYHDRNAVLRSETEAGAKAA